jgi:hypothetical protein
MRFTRAAFVAGVAVGYIAGSRAGREQYDRIVKYSRMAVTSEPAQQAGHAIAAKATDLRKSVVAKAPQARDDATKAAKAARDRVVKINVPKKPKMPKPPKMPKAAARLGRPGWRSGAARPDEPSVPAQPSANGRKTSTYKD